MILLQATQEAAKSPDLEILIAMIAAIASLVVGSISLVVNRLEANGQVRKERRDEIYKKLNDFYGPFQQYLNSSKELYKLLTSGKPKEFRTLTYLLDRGQIYTYDDGTKGTVVFDPADDVLLAEIFEVGKKMEILIVEKGGLIDNKELRYDYTPNPAITDVNLKGNGLLAQAKTHFQVIRLAKEGRLIGRLDRFKNYVFPRELPIKIEAEIQKLKNELNELNSNSFFNC